MSSDFTEVEKYTLIARLVRLLFESEDACLATQSESILRGASPDARKWAEKQSVYELAVASTDRFIALRLAANDRTIPLIDDGDEDIVLYMTQEASKLDRTNTHMLFEIIGSTLDSLAISLGVVGQGDGYTGLWMVAEAISQAAIEQGVDASQILDTDRAEEAAGFRAEVFRRCMSPQQWQTLGNIHVFQYENNEGLPEDTMTETWTEARTLIAQLSREYFMTREREIWP